MEIDKKITDLSRKYFSLPEDVKVTTYDGRAYLQAADKKYDVIIVDAYQDITIPFQMSSVEFFSMVKEHLNENGVMVVNMNMRGNSEGNINQYLSDTIASVFENVVTVYEAGNYIMTDDKAPVELLGMQVIDQLIQEEVAYYKGIYEQKGIGGLLETL